MTITRLGMCYDYQAAPHAMEQSDRVWNEKSIQRCLKTLLLMITGFFRTIKILFVPTFKISPIRRFSVLQTRISRQFGWNPRHHTGKCPDLGPGVRGRNMPKYISSGGRRRRGQARHQPMGGPALNINESFYKIIKSRHLHLVAT